MPALAGLPERGPEQPGDQPEPAVDRPAPATPITTVRTFTFGTTKKPQ